MNISQKIYQLCKSSQYSQEALAHKVGVSRQAVSKWESGQSMLDPDKLLILSDLFGVSVDELLKDTPSDQSRRRALKPRSYLLLIILCLMGFAGSCLLALWTVLDAPGASQTAEPITIHLTGHTFACLLFAAVFAVSAVICILLKLFNKN